MFGKKKDQDLNDPQQALEHASNTLNHGLTGGLTKAFLGKGFVDSMNATINQGQQVMNEVQQEQMLAQTGADATATRRTTQNPATSRQTSIGVPPRQCHGVSANRGPG